MLGNLKLPTILLNMLKFSERGQNNFDIVRLCLAIFVFLGHYTWIFPNGPLPVGIVMFLAGEGGQRSVQAFFIISGFLMFQSFERSDRPSVFYEKRVRRIIPGYATVILFSALFGFWLSDVKVSEYFSMDLLKYTFWNLLFLNFMHPTLPGLFDQSPTPYVNAPLWTLKIEVGYYILFPLLYGIGRRVGFLSWFIALYVLSTAYYLSMITLANKSGLSHYNVLAAQLPGQLRFFLAGAMVASHHHIFAGKHPRVTLGILASGVVGILCFGGLATLYPALLALALLSFCLIGPKLGSWLVCGDLSYGIYIVHFPLLQAMKSLGVLRDRQGLLFVVTTISVFSLAALLWHFIEGPALRGRWIKTGRDPGPRLAKVANVSLGQ
jgi:peptidoglycan/LPS O-acetylase OafA/YrhL